MTNDDERAGLNAVLWLTGWRPHCPVAAAAALPMAPNAQPHHWDSNTNAHGVALPPPGSLLPKKKKKKNQQAGSGSSVGDPLRLEKTRRIENS